MAVEPFQALMTKAGLDTTVPTAAEMDAASSSEAPYWIGHRLAAAMLVTMRMDACPMACACACVHVHVHV